MKSFTSFFCIILVILLQSCKDNKPTAPEDSNQTSLVEATIGSNGGSLGNDNFNLIIPKDAFETDAKLSLYLETAENPFGSEEISQLFKIVGIPDKYNNPLLIKIKLNTTINDSVSIAVGGKCRMIDSDKETISYTIFDAKDSSGYAILYLPEPRNIINTGIYKNSNSNNDEASRWIVALFHPGKYITKNGNFKIQYPKSVSELIPSIDNYFEDAFSEYLNLGFKKVERTETQELWPISIIIKNFSQDNKDVNCLNVLSIKEDKFINMSFEINKEKLVPSEMNKMRREIGKMVYYLFPFMNYVLDMFNVHHFWFYKANCYWAEELFPRTNNYVPAEFSKGNYSFFSALQPGSGSTIPDCINHAPDVLPFIKYLTSKYDEKITSKIFSKLEMGKSAVDAIIKSLNDPENIWWPNFIKEYLSGNIYNLQSDKIISQIKTEDVFDINNEKDTLKYFSGSYGDLSARVFKINLNYQGIDEKAKLRFKLGPASLNFNYVTVMVFGLKNGKIEYIDQSSDLTIANIKNLMSTGINTLIACVINSSNAPPYTGSSSIDLEVSFKEDAGISEFKKCILSFYIKGKYESDSGPFNLSAIGYWEFTKGGTFEGNTFTAKWDSSDSGQDQYGYEYERSSSLNISGKIDLNTKTITDFYAENKKVDYHQLFSRSITARSVRVNDSPIPKADEGTNWFKCRIAGSNIDLSKLVVTDRIDTYKPDSTHTWLEFDSSIESTENEIYMYFYY